ncbi:MAG: ABC transporter substrate-binding protein [bacterium]
MKRFVLLLMCFVLSFMLACERENRFISRTGPREINIGVILPLTGELSGVGQKVKKGIALAADEINMIGGVDGSRIRLLFFDDKGYTDESARGAEKFLMLGDVTVLIGSVSNESTISIASITSKVRMPMMAPVASQVGITNIGPYTFRNSLTDHDQARNIAEYAFTMKSFRTFAVVYPNTQQGMVLNKIFTQRIQEIGGKVIANEQYSTPIMDFSALVSKLKVIEPQTIYFAGSFNEAVAIAREANQQNLDVVFLGTSEWGNGDIIESGGIYMNGAIFTSSFYKDSTDPLSVNFVKRFEMNFREDPDGFAAQGYDALRVIVQAMFVGGKTREGIREGLLKIENFPGVTGRMSFKANGDVTKEVVILGVYNGQIVQLQ